MPSDDVYMSQLIQTLGQELCCNADTIYIAVIFARRFFTRHSFGNQCFIKIGAASILLATKTEENRRYLSLITKLLFSLTKVFVNTTSEQLADMIKKAEETLIETLAFDFDVDTPYSYMSSIEDFIERNQITPLFIEFKSIYLAVINDLVHTPIITIYSAKHLCIGSAYFALSCLTSDPVDLGVAMEMSKEMNISGDKNLITLNICHAILNSLKGLHRIQFG